jgi:hypothetical protein
MPTIRVRCPDAAIKRSREQMAQRVMDQFDNRLPGASVLCFFDDQDWQSLREAHGRAIRGLYTPVKPSDDVWNIAPSYLLESLFDDSGRPAFESFIYLHGSTCATDIGLAMTFSHELQHFVQRCTSLRLWAANTLVSQLLTRVLQLSEIRALGIKSWCDVPHECEARVVSKRTAERLFGAQLVDQYIDSKTSERLTDQDADDWRCIRGIDTSVSYDLAAATTMFYPRLKKHRLTLENCLQQNSDDADFENVNLPSLLNGLGV